MLLRHAKAEPAARGADDFDRPLAPKGHAAARALGPYLRDEGLLPDLVLCSSSRRTLETWSDLALEGQPAAQGEDGLYLAAASALLVRLRALPETASRVLLIGHNPGLEDLSLQLAGSGDKRLMQKLEQGLPTSGLVVLQFADGAWSELVLGTGAVVRFLLGKEL